MSVQNQSPTKFLYFDKNIGVHIGTLIKTNKDEYIMTAIDGNPNILEKTKGPLYALPSCFQELAIAHIKIDGGGKRRTKKRHT